MNLNALRFLNTAGVIEGLGVGHAFAVESHIAADIVIAVGLLGALMSISKPKLAALLMLIAAIIIPIMLGFWTASLASIFLLFGAIIAFLAGRSSSRA